MRSLKIFWIVAGALLTIYVIARLNRPKELDWTETLSSKEKSPFGTFVLSTQLKDLFPGSKITPFRQPVYNVIAEDSVKDASYIIVCHDIELSKPDYEQLMKYIKAGNDVFIAAESFGALLHKNLDISTKENYNAGGESTPIKFSNPSLDSGKYYRLDKGLGDIYFSKFDTAHAVVLGETNDHNANFIKQSFGKGTLYLAVNPKLFTNYSLLKPEGAEYAATALSHLKTTKQIIWDEYYTQGDAGEDTPMRVIFSKPALAWAYYITIFSLLVFVLFEIKRTQRIIPVIEPLTNSTLEFVNVVGQVYYEKRNNANIAHKKIVYLLEHLRGQYNIKTNKLDDEFTEKLAAKLGLEQAFANDLVNYIQFINNTDHVSDRELIELNKIIEKLYSQSA